MSKLRKNEKNAKISLYKIYLPKVHENIMECYRLNLFKEVAIGFNYGLQMTSETPTSLSNGVFAAVILAFSSSLVLHKVLLVSGSIVIARV